MPVINKPPQIVERKYQLEDLVADAAEQYADWIGGTNRLESAVKMMPWRNKVTWRKTQDTSRRAAGRAKARDKSMIQHVLNSRDFVTCLLVAATRMALHFKLSFPGENVFLQVMTLRVPLVHEGNLFLFTTPYIAYFLLTGLYVFGLTVHNRIRAGQLPPYSDPSKPNHLFLVVAEIHDRRKPIASDTPPCLTIPKRARFTGAAIVGAIAIGKTSRCMRAFAEQVLTYRARDKSKRIGGTLLEVKGDFCENLREILNRHERVRNWEPSTRGFWSLFRACADDSRPSIAC